MNLRHDSSLAALTVRRASSASDLASCQALRHKCFFGVAGCDRDDHDSVCSHLMVEQDGLLRATLRTLCVDSGSELDRTLTANSYDLTPLERFAAPILEIGRFCIAPGAMDAHVMRAALAVLTQIVDDAGVGLMVGCTSLAGADPERHAQTLAVLGQNYVGPQDMRPVRRAANTVPLDGQVKDRREAIAAMPPLLRSYLGLGGWVSDHAVVDRVMDTLHVFTCVEVARIPPQRAKALRRLAV